MPAPLTAPEAQTGPAALAMAAAALDGADAEGLVDQIDAGDSALDLARWALSFGYHVHLYTSRSTDEVGEELLEAGLVVNDALGPAEVRAALDARHPLIVSSPGDGPPFLLVLREDEDGLVVDDPSVEDRPVRWEMDRLADLLGANPRPLVLELAARNRADR